MYKIFNQKSAIEALFCFLGILFLAFVLVNALFLFPSVDDYSYYNKHTAQGFWAFQKWHYFNWGGRYIPNAILGSFSYSGTGIYLYRGIAIFIIFSFFSSIYVLVKKIFNSDKIIFLSLVIFASICFSFCSIAQAFYWMPGSITYTLSITLTLLVWTFLSKLKTNWIFFLNLVAVILLNGTNEVSMICFNVSLVMYLLFYYFKNQRIDNRALLLTIISFACMGISILAPGNSVRTTLMHFPNTHNLLFAIPRSVNRGLIFIYEKFFIFIFTVVIVANYAKANFLFLANAQKHRFVFKMIVLSLPIFILISTTFLSYFATGRIPPERTANTIGFFTLSATVFSVLFYKENFGFQISKKAVPIALVVFSLLLLLFPNELRNNAMDLLTGRSKSFSAQMNTRIEMIQSSKKMNIKVKKIENLPKSIFFEDISSDPNDFFTSQYAKYFNKNQISTDE
jgi:hypothetical protein